MLYHTLFLFRGLKRSSLQSRENGMELNREMRLELEIREVMQPSRERLWGGTCEPQTRKFRFM